MNTLSFIVAGENVTQPKLVTLEENSSTINEEIVQSFEIIQKDSYQNQFLNLNFVTNTELKRFERLPITLEKPDGSTSTYNVRTDPQGNFSISLFVENSWDAGKYTISFTEENENIKFGEFTIKKETTDKEVIILSEILETANPEVLYEKTDKFKISQDVLPLVRGGVSLDVIGTISEYSKGNVKIIVYEDNEPVGEYKVISKTNGEFFGAVLVHDSLSEGFHEIRASNNERIIGK